jgi:hypothetical protein
MCGKPSFPFMFTWTCSSAVSIETSDVTMKWEVFGRKRSWPDLGAIAVFAWDLFKNVVLQH